MRTKARCVFLHERCAFGRFFDVNDVIPYWTLVPLYKRVIEVPVYVLALYAPRLIREKFKCLVNKYAVGASASGRTRAGFDGMAASLQAFGWVTAFDNDACRC